MDLSSSGYSPINTSIAEFITKDVKVEARKSTSLKLERIPMP